MPAMFWDCDADGVPFQEGVDGETYQANPWDTMYIDHIQVPGLVEVHPQLARKIDRNKKNGADGATMIDRGSEPGAVDIMITMWTYGQWSKFQELLADVWRFPNKDSKSDRPSTVDKKLTEQSAATVDHPALQALRISSLVFQTIEGPIPGAQPGTRVVKMKTLQYVPPNRAVQNRKFTGGGVGVVDPLDKPSANEAGKPPSVTAKGT